MNMKQSKKIKSAAEIAWGQAREDERWEIRVEYLQEFFSPSVLWVAKTDSASKCR
jgi:hypothetical protein